MTSKSTIKDILCFKKAGIEKIMIMADRDMAHDGTPICLVSYKQFSYMFSEGQDMAKHKKSKTKKSGNGTKVKKGRKRKTLMKKASK